MNLLDDTQVLMPRAAAEDELARVHSCEYIAADTVLDPLTYLRCTTRPDSVCCHSHPGGDSPSE